MQRLGVFAFGHLDFTLFIGDDEREKITLFGGLGDDRFLFALTGSKQAIEGGHDVVALVLGWLMATMALGLKNGPDLAVVTDRFFGGLISGLSISSTKDKAGD